MENLWRRKIVNDPYCGRCKLKMESAAHALFYCKVVKKFWEGTRFANLICSNRVGLVQEVFLLVRNQVEAAAFSLFCVLVWAVWNERNSILNNGRVSDPSVVASRAIAFLCEYTNSSSRLRWGIYWRFVMG